MAAGFGCCIRIPFADRFWSHVTRPRFPNGALDYNQCWDWTGKTTGTQNLTGELRLPASKKAIKAPRAALLLWEGATDADIEARNRSQPWDAGHTVCDRPQCCNPTHLAWQPHRLNIHEYIRKYQRLAGRARNTDNLPPHI